ncbi:hypothetical protein H206_00442 [Candidatus Electrothrix aarhusensis]|uniref:Uncharacterized protein n=1 Tax=Candidatus Electrothrix aarhusensis TaxID=1859131 RepID=A0A3S4T4P3_9BACT|nr:hypothetical protein H206_00442 [Candidatus Electrothrix aarhusensis]
MNIHDLKCRFDGDKNSYAYVDTKKKYDLLVSYEEWASGGLYDMEPLEAMCFGEEIGKKLKKKPTRVNGKTCYQFDSDRRIIIRQEGTELPNRFNEEFFSYEDNEINSVRFGTTQNLINAKSRILSEGKIIKVLSVGTYGDRTKLFNYENGIVVSIDVEEISRGQTQTYCIAIGYDDEGNVKHIARLFPNGYKETIYPR